MVSTKAALAGHFIYMLGLLDGGLPQVLIDMFAGRQLLLDHVDLGHVLEAARPCAGFQADDAALPTQVLMQSQV